MNRRVLNLLAVVALVAAIVQPVAAQDTHPYFKKSLSLSAGAFRPSIDLSASYEANGVAGTEVDFVRDVGLDDTQTLPWVKASVRLGDRWLIEGEWFRLSNDGSKRLDKTIEWGGVSFPIDTTVTGEFKVDQYRLGVGYSLLRGADHEAGLALGVHGYDLQATLSADGVGAVRASQVFPLPTIGAYVNYAFTANILARARVDWFGLTYNDISGSFWNAGASVEYTLPMGFGVGIGYRYIDFNVDSNKADWRGDANFKFSGPTLYVSGYL